MYVSVSQAIIGSHNGLSSDQRQAIIWTNARLLFTGPLGTIFSEVWIEIHIFSFKKMCLITLSRKWQPFCLSLTMLQLSSLRLGELYVLLWIWSWLFQAVTGCLIGTKSLPGPILTYQLGPQKDEIFFQESAFENDLPPVQSSVCWWPWWLVGFQWYVNLVVKLFVVYHKVNCLWYVYCFFMATVQHFSVELYWRNCPICMVNILASDGLVTQGSRDSLAMLLYPLPTTLKCGGGGGVYWFHFVCPSICL